MLFNKEKTLLLIEVNNKFSEHKRRLHQKMMECLSLGEIDQVNQLVDDLKFAIHMELIFIRKLNFMSDSAVQFYRENLDFPLEDMFEVLIGESDL